MEDHTSSKEVTSTNVPPIPARNEGMPPAIPARNHSVPPPIPVQNQSVPPPIPVRAPKETAVPESSPRRRPIGAVATALISTEELGHKPSGSVDLARVDDAQQQQADDTSEEPLSRNPYDLKATAGSTVTASYPFHGDESVQQLSFAVGDVIKVKEKHDMWSWGVLERGGKEGWFPHNYVGSTFKPLPGIHEMAAKLRERREKLDAQQAREGATTTNGQDDSTKTQDDATKTQDDSTVDPVATQAASSHSTAETSVGDTAGTSSVGNTGVEPGLGMQSRDAMPQEQEATTGGDDVKAVTPSSAHHSALDPDQEKPQRETAGGSKAVLSSDGPAPPPFFVVGKDSNVKATETAPTMRANDDVQASEVHEAAQIQGVGNVGESIAKQAGCKCVLM